MQQENASMEKNIVLLSDATVAAREYAMETQGMAGSAQLYADKQRTVIDGMKQTYKNVGKLNSAFSSFMSFVGNVASMIAFSFALGLISDALDNLFNGIKNTEEKAQNVLSDISLLNLSFLYLSKAITIKSTLIWDKKSATLSDTI